MLRCGSRTFRVTEDIRTYVPLIFVSSCVRGSVYDATVLKIFFYIYIIIKIILFH